MKLHRTIAMVSAVTMLLASVNMHTVYAAGTPVTRGEAAEMLVQAAAGDYTPNLDKEDILKGYEDGQLHQEQGLTRAEALVMLKRAFGEFPAPTGHNLRTGYPAENFTDIPDWADEEISDVLASGIIAGTSESTLSPNDPITKEQLETLIKRTYAYMGKNLKDDYWATVNKNDLDTLEIKDGRAYVGGSFNETMNTVDEQMIAIRDELLAGSYAKGSKEQKIADFYRSVLNKEYRAKTGMTPIMPYMELIDKAQNIEDIVKINNTLIEETALSPFMTFGVYVDNKDNSKNIIRFSVLSGFLGISSLYEDEDTIDEYRKLINTYFKSVGETDEEADREANLIIDYESRVMKYFPDIQELNDVDKTYNLYKLDDIKEMFPGVDIDSVFAASGYDESWKTTDILLICPDYTKAIGAEFTNDNIDTLKAYAKFVILYNMGSTLSDELLEAEYTFEEKTGMGTRETDEIHALSAIEGTFYDYLGEIYANRYFSAEKKQNIENMVNDILDVYRTRIENVDWMSDKTKEKALLKLNNLNILIGYPQVFDDPYEYAEINSDSLYDNIVSLSLSSRKKDIEEQFKPIDKNYMGDLAVYDVNAGYVFSANEIVFPAAFFQAPFYDYDAPYEANLGGAGYVITHEISHAFDDSGSKYDENGNAINWWTDEDREAFDALCDKMAAFYDNQEIAPGILSDGELTLGEDIADNGSMRCILEVASHLENPDYDTLFRAAAHCYANSSDRSILEFDTVSDVHSNGKLRVNRVFQNNQIFYDTYGIKEGDGMYVAPDDRVYIW